MKICKECREEYSVGGNSFYKLCNKCNIKRLGSKKVKVNIVDTLKNKPIIHQIIRKSSSFKTLEVKHKNDIINPYNVSGEKELFLIIWSERDHVCINCRKELGDELVIHFFSHIYPKSIRPWLRLDPNNIELLCFECHHNHDFGKRVTKLN